MASDSAAENTGTLVEALAHAARLVAQNPVLAERQAREILAVVPRHPQAELVLASALRAQDKMGGALAILRPLSQSQPRAEAVHFELGMALAESGDARGAIAAFLHTTMLVPKHPQAWRMLGDQFTLIGDAKAADSAYARHIQASINDPKLLEAAQALCENKLAIAERLLRAHLKENPTDVAAIRMLAEAGSRLNRFDDAESLLARCLELAPSFDAARHNYATVLYRHNKPLEAIAELDLLLERDPRNGGYRSLKAAALGRIGEYESAIACYEAVLKEHPRQPKSWLTYGHALKTIGRTDDAVAAYRRSIQLMPQLGEAYWSLANLKTYRFSEAEIGAMQVQLKRTDLSADDRLHLQFALGKALEDRKEFAESFAHYEKGNTIQKARLGHDADSITAEVKRTKALFTRDFIAARAGAGSPAPDPIFIVGLTRSGSTLLEQILSTHSAVEGTMELPDLIALTRKLGGLRRRGEVSSYPDLLASLEPAEFTALGEEYLARTRIQRKLSRPFFIDKMPNNWLHTGFIHLILPKAKIVDARRHPLACCFSNFKQHFARGQAFTYGLTDIGRYYADYVELMAHFDAVLPGRVHRVLYERMIADPEAEVRALLAYCGLPFEAQCLRFYENERAVRTASSEQVRQPLYSDALEQWVHYEPWLGELKEALGPVLKTYPDVPAF